MVGLLAFRNGGRLDAADPNSFWILQLPWLLLLFDVLLRTIFGEGGGAVASEETDCDQDGDQVRARPRFGRIERCQGYRNGRFRIV